MTTSLWSPVTIRALTLRHRLVMAAMGTGFASREGAVTDRLLHYVTRQARGGIALVTTEATAVDASGAPFPGVLRAHAGAADTGLRQLADAVHAHNVPVSLQIYHAGRQMSSRVSGRRPVAPSAIPCPLVREPPRALERHEIEDLIEAFADAAARARAAGLDAVELHGAHGYLLHQFLTPLANQRTDDYGGDLRGRARFVLAVVRRVRERVGSDFPILFKLSAEDRLPGGLTIDDTLTIGRWLEETGVDVLIVSAGSYGSFEWVVQPITMPTACLRGYAARFRQALKIPVAAVGRINDPALAADIVQSGDADLVVIGRALLADPDFPRKAQTGQNSEIRPCITCNDCLAQLMKTEPIRCAVNPELGREVEFPPPRAAKPKRIVVVGGGLAGMQAALVARERGHEVTLLEADSELGGRFRLGARVGLTADTMALVSHLARQLEAAGVTVHLDVRVTAEDIRRRAPDVVIAATGARAGVSETPGVREPYVQTAEQCLTGEPRGTDRAVVIGGGITACLVAWYLCERGLKVTVVSSGRTLARDLESVTRRTLLAELERREVRVLSDMEVRAISNDHVQLEDQGGRSTTVLAALAVLAPEVSPQDGLWRELRAMGQTVHAVGDCAGLGGITNAIHGATDAAMRL